MTKVQSTLPAMPFGNFFPSLQDFVYVPWTNWQGMFQNWFSPKFVFGNNVEDLPVEEHVVGTVGSYGKQLNRVFDALEVVVSEMEFAKLNKRQQRAVVRFEDMARQADAAAARFQGKSPSDPNAMAGMTASQWIEAVDRLRKESPDVYAQLSDYIKA